jgi:hypothetical protein
MHRRTAARNAALCQTSSALRRGDRGDVSRSQQVSQSLWDDESQIQLCGFAQPAYRSRMMDAHRFAILAMSMVVGCGGDDRPSTAPSLPIVEQEAPCSEFDLGSDGSVDAVYTYEYDADGFIVKMMGSGGDITAYTYDDDHFVLAYSYNEGTNPMLETEYLFTRDSYGRVLTYEHREDGVAVQTTVNTYDGRGRVQTQVDTHASDGETTTSTLSFTYNGDRKFPASARQTFAERQFTVALKYTTSLDERMVHIDYDNDEDGTIEGISDYVYDADGKTLRYTRGSLTDIEYREAATYNSRGSTLTFVQSYGDESTPDDYQYYATFDAAGMKMKAEARSPSGHASTSVYTDTYKAQCASTATRTAVRPPELSLQLVSMHRDARVTVR